jgi:Ca-activated chloride channel family protein
VAIGCAVIAFGGLVLARSGGSGRTRAARAHPTSPGQPGDADAVTVSHFEGPGLRGQLALTQGAVAAGRASTVYAEVELEAAKVEASRRAPVALAVVLDTSGSMSGEKIGQARQAVRRLVAEMEPEDRVALVEYDSRARLLQELAPVTSVREGLSARIASLQAGGGTNIPRGLELGVDALTDAPDAFVRRVVLVSDGIDGSGQSVPHVSAMVRTQAGRGLTTSALGIGVDYDERFLLSVADAGRGNYQFLAKSIELAGFLRKELHEAASTTIVNAIGKLALPDGARFVRAFGVEATASGSQLTLPFGSLYAGEKRRALVELEVAASSTGAVGELALELPYRHRATGDAAQVEGNVALRAVTDPSEALASRDAMRHAAAVATVVDHEQQQALEAWEKGHRGQAMDITRRNKARLEQAQQAAPGAPLEGRIAEYEEEADMISTGAPSSSAGKAFRLERRAARRQRARTAK